MILSPRETPKLDVPRHLLRERTIEKEESRGRFLLSDTSYRGFQKAELRLLGEWEKKKTPGWKLFPLVAWDEFRGFGAHWLAVVFHFPSAGCSVAGRAVCAVSRPGPGDALAVPGSHPSLAVALAARPAEPRASGGAARPSSFLPPLNPIHPALRLTSSQSSPLPGRPGSAPLFKLWPLEVPPHPPHWLRDGAGEERARHVNFPLFFRAPKTGGLPSNFCGATCAGAHYVKHTFSSLRKVRGALRRPRVVWEYRVRRGPSVHRLVRHRGAAPRIAGIQTCCGWSQRKLPEPSLQSSCTYIW